MMAGSRFGADDDDAREQLRQGRRIGDDHAWDGDAAQLAVAAERTQRRQSVTFTAVACAR